MSGSSKAAIGCIVGMVLAMVFGATTLLMLRDWIKPRSDLGLARSHWIWAAIPAALTVWAVRVMLQQSAILDAIPER